MTRRARASWAGALLVLASCAPTPQADPLRLAFDEANRLGAKIDQANRAHEERLRGELRRRFEVCREAVDLAARRVCYRDQARDAQDAVADEMLILWSWTNRHSEALDELRTAQSCRQQGQACAEPARQRAEALLAELRAELPK